MYASSRFLPIVRVVFRNVNPTEGRSGYIPMIAITTTNSQYRSNDMVFVQSGTLLGLGDLRSTGQNALNRLHACLML